MEWKAEIEKILSDHIPYAFPVYRDVEDKRVTERGVPLKEEFEDAVGYVVEWVWVQMKKAFMEGYAQGLVDETLTSVGIKERLELGRFPAERAWNRSSFSTGGPPHHGVYEALSEKEELEMFDQMQARLEKAKRRD